ncbi:MAG: TIM barrel protein, partial [Phaeodactylibacter sp.]|nr:TIM barrel protein [Phaeodactylibacter sp.]
QAIHSGALDPLDFAAKARSFGIGAVEYVNQLYGDIAGDRNYLQQMLQRAQDNGVVSHLIMIDHEGDLGNTNDAERQTAVENHFKWVTAAKYLGCKTIRVNAAGKGSAEEVAAAAVDGLGKLAEFAKQENINVVVENHGGYSSDAQWLLGVLQQVNLPNLGTLPDFGNFCIEKGEDGQCRKEYDRYTGTKELMPLAKAVSAKAYDFDASGNETTIDFKRLLGIVQAANFSGYIGLEYEGKTLPEEEGIRATKALLERVGEELGYLKGG